MIYNSKQKVQSKLEGFTDVFFTLKKMTEGRRIKSRLLMAPLEVKLFNIGAALKPILAKIPEGQEDTFVLSPEDDATARILIAQQTDLIKNEIDVAWMTWGLASIEGLKSDETNKPLVTAEDLLEEGPPELFAEILEAIKEAAALSEKKEKTSA